jgi:phosphoglycerate dehydrogenase-like enzyme
MNASTQRKVVFACGPGPIRNQLWTPHVQQLARELGFDVRLHPETPKANPKDWPRLLSDADGMITTWGAPQLNNAVLGESKLRIVGHAAGSVAPIVSPDLYDRGIRVVTANPVMAQAVAEYSLMMTLIARTRLTGYAQIGRCPLDWAEPPIAGRVGGATIGIWGYGEIGRRLIGMLRPLQPGTILIHSASLPDAQAAEMGLEKVDFDTLFARCDVIHLLAGLTPANRHRVGAKQLAAIRDGAALINAGRADLVQADALLDALGANRFTAILDVHYDEPLPPDSPFRQLPNVILTPHSAGFPGREQYVPFILQEFARFFANQPLESEITRERAGVMTDESLMTQTSREDARSPRDHRGGSGSGAA